MQTKRGKPVNMFKCDECEFFGSELNEVIVSDWEPYGSLQVERQTVYHLCPECGGEDFTEYKEVT